MMRKKSNMNWQSAICLSGLITILLTLPLFFPLYIEFMGEEMLGFTRAVPRYVSLLYGAGVTFSITLLLFIHNFHILKKPFDIVKQNVYLVAGTLPIIALFGILQLSLHAILFSPENDCSLSSFTALGILLNDISIAVIVFFISHIINLSDKRQQMALQYETLKVENMQIRYAALKNQLNPHFLFNTMSILDSLVDEDTQKTHEYIQRFSSVYRYILQTREVVTLSEELDFLDNYFGLLQVRYGESLVLVLEINPAFNNYSIVPLGLQTLMENAVQHNIISRRKPLYITISTIADGQLVVSNNYQPKPMATSGAGIGLANLSERYLLKWRRNITIEQTDDVFRVILPLILESPRTV